ncbi:Glucose 1-dehydrogenase [bacterium HR29]|nr:Glucose 1-dehydrogenase [bacterium HR29]
MRLSGKVAVVTGGGTGIGAAIAKRFAREGAVVVISGRRPQPLADVAESIAREGGEVEAVACDSATEEGVERLFRKALEFGRLDVLVNNAAIAGPVAPIWDQELAGWEETLRINLTGPFLCSRAAARAMIPRRSGRIINIGSISGKRPLATRSPYTTTKMGLVGLTRTLALELGEYGITVNVISPGAVDTPRLNELAERWHTTVEALRSSMAAQAALRRINEPDDIAALAAFLASDEARNITGIDITVDAGVWFS